jgi:hypothetical protein
MLGFVAIEVSSLVAEVEDEPQLDAWVGDDDADPVRGCLVERLGPVRMFISVEYAPDFVVCFSLASRLSSRLDVFRLGGVVDELQRAAMEVVDCHDNRIPERTPPIDEVPVLGLLALAENQEFTSCQRRTCAAEMPPRLSRRQLSPAVMNSAAAANSSWDRIGIAP